MNKSSFLKPNRWFSLTSWFSNISSIGGWEFCSYSRIVLYIIAVESKSSAWTGATEILFLAPKNVTYSYTTDGNIRTGLNESEYKKTEIGAWSYFKFIHKK